MFALATLPEYRGRGIAKQLVQQAFEARKNPKNFLSFPQNLKTFFKRLLKRPVATAPW